MRVGDDDKDNEGSLTNRELADSEPSSWGPIGDDGIPRHLLHGIVSTEMQARPFTAEHVPCLRHCRHFMTTRTHFDAGNPADDEMFAEPVTQAHHICMAVPGVFLELSGDSPVYECNRWDPDVEGAQMREIRREAYLKIYPLAARRQRRIGDDIEEDEDDDELDDLDIDDDELDDEPEGD